MAHCAHPSQNASPHRATPPQETRTPNPAVWVDEHGDVLYRYAMVRVRRRDVAEDLVQETLLAALNAKERFQGQSTERTWLVSILRHKIMDHLRSRSRGMAGAEQMTHDDWLKDFFDERGRWIEQPDPDAVKPEALLERKEFWEAFDGCLDELPPRSREAFARRVMEQEDTQTVCKALKVTATHLWVILFRARTQMRRCLMLKWFRGDEPGSRRRES